MENGPIRSLAPLKSRGRLEEIPRSGQGVQPE